MENVNFNAVDMLKFKERISLIMGRCFLNIVTSSLPNLCAEKDLFVVTYIAKLALLSPVVLNLLVVFSFVCSVSLTVICISGTCFLS